MRTAICLLALVCTLGMAGTASGAEIYAASYVTDALYLIDTETGDWSMVGAFGAGVSFDEGDLALDANQNLWGVFTEAADALFTVDKATGLATQVGDPLGYADVSALAFGSDSSLYGADSDTDRLITIDTATGVGSVLGDGPAGIANIGFVAGMDFHSSGDMYLTESFSDELYVLGGIMGGDDDAVSIADLGALGISRPAALTFGLEGGQEVLFVINAPVNAPSELYRVYPDGGVANGATVELVSLTAGLPEGIGGMASYVPEPASATVLMLGVLALARRRR